MTVLVVATATETRRNKKLFSAWAVISTVMEVNSKLFLIFRTKWKLIMVLVGLILVICIANWMKCSQYVRHISIFFWVILVLTNFKKKMAKLKWIFVCLWHACLSLLNLQLQCWNSSYGWRTVKILFKLISSSKVDHFLWKIVKVANISALQSTERCRQLVGLLIFARYAHTMYSTALRMDIGTHCWESMYTNRF